jgi:predicted MFS family arabinose efflux permease
MLPNTIWFDVALLLFVYGIGTIFFGHFEERTPKIRRVVKIVFFTALVAVLSALFGHAAVFAFLGIMAVFFVIVHGWYLPKHGINGLTGEPREKYYALRGWTDATHS